MFDPKATASHLDSTKMRRTQREQFESAIPHFPDLDRASGYFAEGPKHEVTALQPAARGKSREARNRSREDGDSAVEKLVT